jgi:FG-GAP-like repeat
MKRLCWLALFLSSCVLLTSTTSAQENKATKISWKKIVIDKAFRSEGVGVTDVNKDGKLDIIVGDCWYEAPKDPNGEWKRHILRADRTFDLLEYSKSFACFAEDFTGDGYPDVIVIPFPGEPCYWYENPGAAGGKWKPHLLTNSACNETPIYIDLFKNGKKLLVMGWNPPRDENNPTKGSYDDRGEMCYFLPGKDPTQPWQRISISGPSEPKKKYTVPGTRRFDHGLGHGDVNGDGRIDIICRDGWWEQPEKPDGKPWKFHATRITDQCADMYVLDVDGDGKADILSSSAHGYGFWWSQQKDANTFVQRTLFPAPGELAKLPTDYKFTNEEKALIEAINKLRTSHYLRAPFVVHPELCQAARIEAEKSSTGDRKSIDHKYPGKVVFGKAGVLTKSFFEKNQDKDKRTPLQKFALQLLPDNEKEANLVRPGLEIGVGTAEGPKGDTLYYLLIGDRGQFSLPSQTHALNFVDLDGDGLKDLITGRRWWAHGPRGDGGPNDPAYLYWFQAKRGKDGMTTFVPHLIDDDSGIGTQFTVADVNGDGLLDIVTSNKRGVHVFLQQRGQ